MVRVILAALAAFLLLALPASANKQIYTLTFSRTSQNFQTPVEQQTPGGATQPDPSLWVINPLIPTCAWDADDRIEFTSIGDVLAPGESVTHTECLIADHVGHFIAFSVAAARVGLAVTVTFPDYPGHEYVLSSAQIKPNTWSWRGCIIGPEFDSDAINFGALPEIAGSNGGRGKITRIVFSITNASSRTIRDIHADGVVSINNPLDSMCRLPFVRTQDVADPWYAGAFWNVAL